MNNQRIIGFDIARAFAVFGMVLVNYKLVMGASENGPRWLVTFAHLFEGRAVAVFVVLAGVGISLLTHKARVAGDGLQLAAHRKLLWKRALFLFVVGLAYSPIWPADILHFYGVYIAFAALLLSVSSRKLLAIAVAVMLLFVVLVLTLDYEQGWNWLTLEYAGFWTASGMARHIFFNGFHPVIPWVAFLLFGMILGRTDLTVRATRLKWLLLGVGVTAFAEFTSSALIQHLTAELNWYDFQERSDIHALFGTAPMPPMPLYMLAGTGVACVVISLSVSLGQKFADATWLKPFVHTGQLALTLYVAHVILGMGTLEAAGRLNNQTLKFSVGCTVGFCVLAVLFAHLWRMRFKRGPLEMAMRWLTG